MSVGTFPVMYAIEMLYEAQFLYFILFFFSYMLQYRHTTDPIYIFRA